MRLLRSLLPFVHLAIANGAQISIEAGGQIILESGGGGGPDVSALEARLSQVEAELAASRASHASLSERLDAMQGLTTSSSPSSSPPPSLSPSPPPSPSPPLPPPPSSPPPSPEYAASLTIQGDGFCQDGGGNRYDWIAVTGKTFNDVSDCAVACQATNCRGFTFLATWSCYIQYDEGTPGYPDTLMATITALDGPITGSSSQTFWTGTGAVQSTNGDAGFGKCYTPP
jgi:hypothetical protein